MLPGSIVSDCRSSAIVGPNASELVVPLTVPALMDRPELKVLTPERISAEVLLFSMTFVTCVPMTPVIVVAPEVIASSM